VTSKTEDIWNSFSAKQLNDVIMRTSTYRLLTFVKPQDSLIHPKYHLILLEIQL